MSKHVWWTHHADSRWGVAWTVDGPGLALFLGRRALVVTWGEWS